MKSIRFHEYGGADMLRYEDAPDPSPGPSDVIVHLRAAALNHLDLWVRGGDRERNIPLPHIPGSDGAGVIAETGTAAGGHLKAGDRVLISPGISCGHCAHCLNGRDNLCAEYHVLGTRGDGTYAEFVRIPAVNVLPVPEGLDFNQAAAVPLVFLTAWHMLVTLARVRPGSTVLVHACGSGVGSAAVQIAKFFNAHVITTAGSDEKLSKASALGADDLINYRTTDFTAEVKRLTGKRGVDIVFEHIGGDVLQKSIPLISKGGCLVTCGATAGFNVPLDVRYIFSRHLSVFGSMMGSKAELIEVLKYFGKAAGTRRFVPIIDTIFPLSDAAKAHRLMEERTSFGKIVLSIP